MVDPIAWQGVSEGVGVGLTSNPKIAQLWRETGRTVTALVPETPSASNPVDQPKVSELRDRLKTARHMTGIPPAVDAIIEELFAALTPQATTVGKDDDAEL